MKRILLVEDDTAYRKMLVAAFKDTEYQVVEAANGVEGVESYRQQPCDLIITDFCMPQKDGMELIAELKNEFPNSKIILCSGTRLIAGKQILETAIKKGADRSLRKPMPFKNLLGVVQELI